MARRSALAPGSAARRALELFLRATSEGYDACVADPRGAAAEFIDAVRNLLTMIEQFGGDTLPNGKGSKVELEQVYVIQKDKLGKNARMAFLQLDSKATQLASPKREGIED